MCAEDDESDQDTGYDQGGRNTQPGPSQVRKQHDNVESDAQREQLAQAFRLPQARQRDNCRTQESPGGQVPGGRSCRVGGRRGFSGGSAGVPASRQTMPQLRRQREPRLIGAATEQ
jgi:hypothetical protein